MFSVYDERISNQTPLVGHSFPVKKYLSVKFFSRTPDQDIYINTKSSPEQNSNSKIKIKEGCGKI